MKKRAILILGVALMIAAAGVVYAHWTETLRVDATVYTGDAFVRWTNIFTDDDGGNSIGEEIGLPTPKFCTGDPTCTGPGSVDPSSFSVIDLDANGLPVLTLAATRYDKDVADCWSGITDGLTTGKLMWVQIANAYPSYHCTISSTFQNQGSVPMMQNANPKAFFRNGVAVLPVPAPGGGYYILDPLTNEPEIFFRTMHGTLCGQQVDPGESVTTVNVVHVMNAESARLATYKMEQELEFVNWNESAYYGTIPAVCPFELLP